MKINCTVQSFDYSCEDMGPFSEQQVLDLMRSNDWATELEHYRALEDQGEDNCPPSIHLGSGDGTKIAICTTTDGLWWCSYYYPFETKKFWIFAETREECHVIEERPRAEAEKCVTAFFGRRHGELLSS